ncbi:DUF3618 domain-containing protein [Actinoplanes sp. NEAU-A12]|uniref:DUF3618 domain-containing protein n=1 Tax=Actinoplanes sandaracinus TaxID=3045177 RepID=A0ABT6WYS5_9ACTN|nr:DUF3618 domain-containing protein [Actinoplanes sandaracinus]MDI6104908.1 DUF3618 domain-containing protein [Actinoplanes sandaracinus]
MAEEPDRLKRDIENTRASLTRDVDLLAEKTSPRQVAKRRWTAVKEKVMGTTEDTTYAARQQAHRVSDKASELTDAASQKASALSDATGEKASAAADRVRQAPQAVARQTQGNPLAAGIIAFGVGLLTASLMPVTEAERRAGQQLKEHSGDLTDKVKDVAGDLKDELGGTVQQAAGQVRETARDAAQTTKETARSDAQDVRQQARHAANS